MRTGQASFLAKTRHQDIKPEFRLCLPLGDRPDELLLDRLSPRNCQTREEGSKGPELGHQDPEALFDKFLKEITHPKGFGRLGWLFAEKPSTPSKPFRMSTFLKKFIEKSLWILMTQFWAFTTFFSGLTIPWR